MCVATNLFMRLLADLLAECEERGICCSYYVASTTKLTGNADFSARLLSAILATVSGTLGQQSSNLWRYFILCQAVQVLDKASICILFQYQYLRLHSFHYIFLQY